ncbi:HK97 family phage prohead protease [Cereibacter azotoformans]|uniref:Mu-like prophage major head subunit gpT n=1 Tax=Cereibacter azotoformans TaxID=43057 RepID=A0A2T5K756_9RHOB|nr:HK97 family phage prohead protease [Cereibacter azotoformans]MBO4169542.1 HK97 family phage prohead protease [Cereibacter azotoformans]PTR18219.1 Mu-like prophage major head subunit gpT [Cereibacter azotoformans]
MTIRTPSSTPQTRALQVRSASYDEEAGTVEVVYATATPAMRDGYSEVLVISEDAIDTTRLDAGAVALLMDHMPWGRALGTVIGHRIEGDQAIATVKLSVADEHKGLVDDIRAGVIRTVSVGYQILAWEEVALDESRPTAVPVMRVTRWMPAEISLVTIPADPHAQIRSTSADLVRRTTTAAPRKEASMKKKIQTRDAASAAAEVVEEVATEAGVEVTPELEAAVEEAIQTAVETVAEEAATEDDAQADDTTDDTDQAAPADGERAAQIVELCTRHGLSAKFAARHIRAGTDIHRVRSAMLDAIAARSAPPMTTARTQITRDAREGAQRHAEGAVYSLLAGRSATADEAGDLRGARLVDIARRAVGADAQGRSDREVISMVTRSGMHTSGDFSFTAATGAAIERRVRELYENASMALEPLVRTTLVSDFRPVATYSIGGFPELKETAEGAEYEAGTVTSESGTFSIAKFGRILTLSFESIVNDDLRLLDTAIRGAASKGAKLRQKKVREAFSARLADGKVLFHVTRKNLISAPLDVEGLSAARKVLRETPDLDGDAMNLSPKFLVVSPDLETVGQQLISPITAAVTGSVNPFASTLTLIVDPVLSGSEWMLAADPNEGDCIELADLRGYEGVRVDELPLGAVDGVSYRARAFAGAHPTGWRGLVKSTGNG